MKHLVTTASAKKLTTLQARIDITSARLCDDVIHRLAPSLGKYVGGTIIDLNPGNGLFSSKLHNFLNPKCHILMESMQKRYHQYLQPLLEAPDSRYRLRDWDKNRYGIEADYITEGFLPDIKQTSPNFNTSILVVANLARQKTYRMGDGGSSNFQSPEEQAFTFAHEARERSNFFGRGPMRMLMWVDDTEKRPILPRTVGYRSKVSVYLESHCQVEEVVGSVLNVDNNRRPLRRESILDDQSAKRTAERVTDMNVSTSPARIRPKPQDNIELSGVSREWHQEMQRLEKAFENQKIPQFVGMPAGPIVHHTKPRKGKPLFTPEWRKLQEMRRVLRGQNKDMARVDVVLEKQDEIDRLDLAAYRDGIGKAEQDAIFKDLDAKIAELKDKMEVLGEVDLKKYHYRDDDRRAFAMSPPLLMWDRRSAEPMEIDAEEYIGPTPPVLLDLQAKAVDDLPLNSAQSSIFDYLTAELMGGVTRTTAEVLKKAAPGASDALIPKVPELRDPRLGGRRDLASVTNRTLTPKMIHSLTMAWDKWPFKPDSVGLVGAVGLGLRADDNKRRRLVHI